MENVEVTGLDGKTYELQPIKAGQMRDMAKRRMEAEKRGEVASYMDDSLYTIKYCLENAGMQFSMADVEKLDYPTYRKLLGVAQRISGFEEAKPGESPAA